MGQEWGLGDAKGRNVEAAPAWPPNLLYLSSLWGKGDSPGRIDGDTSPPSSQLPFSWSSQSIVQKGQDLESGWDTEPSSAHC